MKGKTMTTRISSRSRELRTLVEARKPFKTHGALYATTSPVGSGWLQGADLERFLADRNTMDYAVVSYDTPIGWNSANGWYRVAQKFSRTTSVHQGKLPLSD